MGPQYDHWCDKCVFLGRYKGPKYEVEYDLYWCPEEGPVARYGDWPIDFSSGTKHTKRHEGLAEAIRRASEEMGKARRRGLRRKEG